MARIAAAYPTRFLALACLGAAPASAQGPVADHAALDVHTHVASPFLTETFTGGSLPPKGADDLVARLDEAHVAGAIILSGGYFGEPVGLTDAANMAPENDFVAAEVAKFPDRLLGFCGINPRFRRPRRRSTAASPCPAWSASSSTSRARR
jgi:predicted TIM-barrel fold metal-dependent hydrolase